MMQSTNTGAWIAILVLALGLIALVLVVVRRTAHQPSAPEPQPTNVRVSHEAVTELQRVLEEGYRQQIEASLGIFAKDLTATSQLLSKQVERLTTDVITRELDEYAKTLQEVRTVATKAAEQIHTTIAEQQTSLQKALEETVAAEQERRLAEIDSHLGEIISSYLIEALGSGVDLGAQTDYILKSLEAHKADIKKDLGHGV